MFYKNYSVVIVTSEKFKEMSLNLTSNLTSEAPCSNNTFPDYQFDLLPAFYCFIFIFGFIGNSLVITVLCFHQDQKTVASIYILNLAMADLLSLVTLPFWATYYAFGLNWIFGSIMCKIASSILSVSLFASIFFVSCMSVDRYLAIVYPLRSKRRTLSHALAMSFAIWTLAFISTLPTFYFRNTYYIENLDVHACIMDFPKKDYSRWCVALSLVKITIVFCFPITVIVTSYLMIGLHLKKSRGPPLNRQNRDRVLKIVTAIVVCFLVCWLPFHALTILDVLTRLQLIEDCRVKAFIEEVMPLTLCLGFSNSCINPLLYCFVGNQFRENFWHVFSSIKMLQSTNSQQNSSRKGSECKEPEPSGACENLTV